MIIVDWCIVHRRQINLPLRSLDTAVVSMILCAASDLSLASQVDVCPVLIQLSTEDIRGLYVGGTGHNTFVHICDVHLRIGRVLYKNGHTVYATGADSTVRGVQLEVTPKRQFCEARVRELIANLRSSEWGNP